MKEEKRTTVVSASSAYRLLHPKLAVLLTCVDKKRQSKHHNFGLDDAGFHEAAISGR
jgi:hypothetical protein